LSVIANDQQWAPNRDSDFSANRFLASVQGRIGTHHAEHCVLWNQQNVRGVTAMFLVKMAPLFRQFKRLPAGDVFQIDDRVGHTGETYAYSLEQIRQIALQSLRLSITWSASIRGLTQQYGRYLQEEHWPDSCVSAASYSGAPSPRPRRLSRQALPECGRPLNTRDFRLLESRDG